MSAILNVPLKDLQIIFLIESNTIAAAQGRVAWHCWGSVAMAAPVLVYYGLLQRDICMVGVYGGRGDCCTRCQPLE